MRRAVYIAMAAITIDGKIARHERHATDWTSPEDKRILQEQLDSADVVVVGHHTFRVAEKQLSKRNCIVLTRRIRKPREMDPKLTYINTNVTGLESYVERQGYRRVAVLGGAQVYSYCLEQGLIDEFYMTVEPLAFGEGVSLLSQQTKARFTLRSVQRLNKEGSILLH